MMVRVAPPLSLPFRPLEECFPLLCRVYAYKGLGTGVALGDPAFLFRQASCLGALERESCYR